MPLPGRSKHPLNLAVLLLPVLLGLLSYLPGAYAFEPAARPRQIPAQGTLEAAFAPWDDVEGEIVTVLQQARRQILGQAYILSSKPIVNSVLAAHQRGIDVRVLVDAGQLTGQPGKSANERVQQLRAAGIEVREESKYKNAHNKVIIIDAGSADATVITGSYNFTWSAQHQNAENILIARNNPSLAEKYAANWMRHYDDARAHQ